MARRELEEIRRVHNFYPDTIVTPSHIITRDNQVVMGRCFQPGCGSYNRNGVFIDHRSTWTLLNAITAPFYGIYTELYTLWAPN